MTAEEIRLQEKAREHLADYCGDDGFNGATVDAVLSFAAEALREEPSSCVCLCCKVWRKHMREYRALYEAAAKGGGE